MRILNKLALCFVGLATLAGCSETWIGEDMDVAPVVLFDQVWEDIDLRYSHFVLKPEVDWRALRDKYRPRAEAAKTDRELFDAICKMIVELKDGHVNLMAPIDTCSYNGWYLPYPHNFDPRRIQTSYLTSGPKTLADKRILYGRISDDIGYIHLTSFAGSGWADEIDVALRDLRGVKALVLDMRDNGGGSSQSAERIAGRFASNSYPYARYQYRNGPSHDTFSDEAVLTVEPTGEERFSGPIALLTNRRCYSACESFTLAMIELPQVVSFGDTTGGGLGNPVFRELPNGWLYRFPVWIEATTTGERLEGKGVPPDVKVSITTDDLVIGRDTILDTALRHLRDQF